MQNEILRCCNQTKLSDRVSNPTLHDKRKIISLEQRMRKQLLWLMYILSRDKGFHRIPNRVTRSAEKIVFKLPVEITKSYEHSPYYIGTKLWDDLPARIQDSADRFAFKRGLTI